MKRRKAVVERTDRVGDYDEIELRCQFWRVRQIFDVIAYELEVRVGGLGSADFRGAEIDTDAFGGLQCIEQMSIATTEIKNAFS